VPGDQTTGSNFARIITAYGYAASSHDASIASAGEFARIFHSN